MALAACCPIKLEGNCLFLGFKYKLHCDILSAQRNRLYLEKIINDIWDQKIYIKAEIIDNLPPAALLSKKKLKSNLVKKQVDVEKEFS